MSAAIGRERIEPLYAVPCGPGEWPPAIRYLRVSYRLASIVKIDDPTPLHVRGELDVDSCYRFDYVKVRRLVDDLRRCL